jgi:ABC-type multidrug transport system ATPase subunit
MISNQGILALEDPFKGLEREESNTVATALKKEAMTGKTILASVGECQSDLLSKFDRLIVLTPNQMVYNGKTIHLKEYLKQRNIEAGDQSVYESLINHSETYATVKIGNSVD